jgi:secondary thiamine-phosphate synthase enzyme
VSEFLKETGLREGFVLVSAMHITAGVFINDWEEGLLEDIDEWVERIAPTNPKYKHHNTGEDNGDAHLKRLLINHQVMIPVTEGKLDLGPWEQIFYAEFDGQRRKRLILKALGI